MKADTSKGNFWNSFGKIISTLDIWSTHVKYLERKKRANQRRLNEKQYFQNFRKSLSWMFDLLFKLFLLTAVLLQAALWVFFKSWLYYSPLMSTSSPAHLCASFRYIFKIALGTRLLHCRTFNYFKSSLILQFFKCYETAKINPFMCDLHHPVKPHFSQKIFCCHAYQFSAATGGVKKSYC